MSRGFGVSVAVALVAACASPRGGASADPALIELGFEPPETCRARLGGEDFVLPGQQRIFLEALAARAKIGSHATVAGGAEIPYKCFGHVVYLAQRAGFRHVGFIAEPPPPGIR